MKYLALLTFIFIATLTQSFAVVTASLTDSTDAPGSVNIAPGNSFTFALNLTSTSEQIFGLTYFLTVDGPGSGFFSLTSRLIGNSVFDQLTTSNGNATTSSDLVTPAGADNLLNPQNDRDLGASVDVTNAGVGTNFVANLTLLSNPTTPLGTYTISLSSNSVYADDQFNPTPISASYTVNVVPEPESVGAVLFGVGALAMIHFRRKSDRIAGGL